MNLQTSLTDLLKIKYPILQAPMAGGPTTAQLVAAVSNAGGLGSLGAGYLSADAIRTAIQAIRAQTDRPFAVNLFVPGKKSVDAQQIAQMQELLSPWRRAVGLSDEKVEFSSEPDFMAQVEVVLAEKVPVFSFTFGIPEISIIQQLKRQHIRVIGTATTVHEAMLLQSAGVDAIVAQGAEAGGHRGTFAGDFANSLIGTMALVPQVVDHVSLPVIASGGIMDGRGLVASLALGAMGVQMGTAFLTSAESGAHPLYKERVLKSQDVSTVVTNVFSGKPARGLLNQFIADMTPHTTDILPYPIQNSLTSGIRKAAGLQNQPEMMSLWAGQAGSLSTTQSAAEIVQRIVDEAEHWLKK